MNIATRADSRRFPGDKVVHVHSPWREVDNRHEHDEGVHKLFSDNRDLYIAQSAATTGGRVPDLKEIAA